MNENDMTETQREHLSRLREEHPHQAALIDEVVRIMGGA